MRRQRIAMVQTKDQYMLVHRAVRQLFADQLRVIEAHPYANLDSAGQVVKPADSGDYEEVCLTNGERRAGLPEGRNNRLTGVSDIK